MRRGMVCIVVVAALLGAAGGQARAASAPSRAAIRRAMTRAERSRYLWATVNICRSERGRGGTIGVRGEMTALGFTSTLAMTVQLRQYDSAHRAWTALRAGSARRTVTVGVRRSGVHQDGAAFRFAAPTGRLDATVTFTWSRGRRRLGTVTRTTTRGHPSAAFAQPARYSAASCRL